MNYKKKLVEWGVPLFAATGVLALGLFTSGCGGGGSSDSPAAAAPSAPAVLTGLFLDSAVSGIQYDSKDSTGTTTHSGTTNATGEFQYETGDSVTFSIGALDLPIILGKDIITPMTFSGGGTDITADPRATNIARLLQSLDDDGNPANGITIPTTAAAAATAAVDFNVNAAAFAANTAVTNLVANSGSTTTALIAEATAQAHFTSTLQTLQNRINGVWRSTGTGGAFSYLLMFTDGTFAYGENDPLFTAPDNGLEVGTYTYDPSVGNITFNVVYDDNAPGTNSGVGNIGTPAVIDAVLSNNNNTLTIAGGEVVLSAVSFGTSPITGAWKNAGAGGAFSIMVLTDDGAFLYGENDLAAAARANGENGLEVGSYSYNSTTGDITFTIDYDDNGVAVGNSGVGDIGTPAVIPSALANANATLTIAGSIVLTRGF